jgi:hypothetical protein
LGAALLDAAKFTDCTVHALVLAFDHFVGGLIGPLDTQHGDQFTDGVYVRAFQDPLTNVRIAIALPSFVGFV